ncbi:unnamed protein product [Oikopleura dioica]|uniref:Metalloendopeptidase n=1 Tax=Oikopleura dioica TaxID=34765 RepID=E4WVF7_OIKDI|nr:unnamed protein product [Oikopleura dioica]
MNGCQLLGYFFQISCHYLPTGTELERGGREDDMIFGEWQAQKMRDKGQSTVGHRIDPSLDINPLYRQYLARNGINRNESTDAMERRRELTRAIGAVVKWDQYREHNKHVIPFYFQDNYNSELREDIKRALYDLGSNTCIDFRLVNAKDRTYDSKIKILSGSGCYSYVGFQGVSEQEISIRSLGCVSRGTVQHEFMHALGFYHEQARPDAKKYIEVKYGNIGNMCGSSGQESCNAQFDQLPLHEWESSSEGSDYDFQSVMHYGGYAFSVNGEPTVVHRESGKPVVVQRNRFSQNDALQICEIYNCAGMGYECMGGKWQCRSGVGHTYVNKVCDGLIDCADGSDEAGCAEKACCDRVEVEGKGQVFVRLEGQSLNDRPIYELEGEGREYFLYYYSVDTDNYWLISDQINTLQIVGYSFEQQLCPQDIHIRSSITGAWKWAWASCSDSPRFGEWSEWDSCQADRRGNCSRKRLRFCKGGQPGYAVGCPEGQNVEKEDCNCLGEEPESVAAPGAKEVSSIAWGGWGAWSGCSRSCGAGMRRRNRLCDGGFIGQGSCSRFGNIESEQCNTHTCPGWANWGAWEGCSKTCGHGQQRRTRNCDGAEVGSSSCPVSDAIDLQFCGGLPCPSWSGWGSWSPCSSSCGQGHRARSRGCLYARIGSEECPAVDAAQMETCTEKDCADQDKKPTAAPSMLGAWSSWSTCSASCGGGSQERTRSCSGRKPQCRKFATAETKNCGEEKCPAALGWADWTAWTQCSSTCGNGEQLRTRACPDGETCPGTGEQRQRCSNQDCPKKVEASSGCAMEAQYKYGLCKGANGKKALMKNGMFAEGTTCGRIFCDKAFYGFLWKPKATKTICTCKNGACDWSKRPPICPIGCEMPTDWNDSSCIKPISKKVLDRVESSRSMSLAGKIFYAPRAGKCKSVSCASDPSKLEKQLKCNCNPKTAICAWNKNLQC